MPPISLEQIRERATTQSFSRGQSYYRDGAIFSAVRRGNDLEGRCAGSDATPYHVRVHLDSADSIIDASCSCPYDWGGDCKHIVALLLTYLHQPRLFEERTPVQDSLMERSKEELIALIRQMLARYPDLQALVDRPSPSRRDVPVDIAPFQREIRAAVGTFRPWNDSTASDTVYSIVRTAKQFSQAGQWRNASAIYRTVIKEGLIKGHYPADDEGDFVAAMAGALAELAECLKQDQIAGDDSERRVILNALVHAYIWDADMGGLGLSDGVMSEDFLHHARPADIPEIRQRIREAQQAQAAKAHHSWAVTALERLLVKLDDLDNTDPGETIARLRRQGLYSLLFAKLLKWGRIEEALDVLMKNVTSDYDFYHALLQLDATGHAEIAIRAAQQTLSAGYSQRIAEWLAQEYKKRGDDEALFSLLLRSMKEAPSLKCYADLKEIAGALGTWSMLRPEIIARLEHEKRYPLLTQVYLQDEEWDNAWKALDALQESGVRHWNSSLALEVAERSCHVRPLRAIEVYVRQALALIDNRNRGSYSGAARYLSLVRDLYRQLDDEQSWLGLITSIREEFRRLRALQEELSKLGL